MAGLCKQRIKSDFKFEVIILDNNSTDDVDAIYRKYREKLDLTFIQVRPAINHRYCTWMDRWMVLSFVLSVCCVASIYHIAQRRKLENTFSVPSGRNIGIKQAKYDFIVGMDSDVILNENFLENLYQFLRYRTRAHIHARTPTHSSLSLCLSFRVCLSAPEIPRRRIWSRRSGGSSQRRTGRTST